MIRKKDFYTILLFFGVIIFSIALIFSSSYTKLAVENDNLKKELKEKQLQLEDVQDTCRQYELELEKAYAVK